MEHTYHPQLELGSTADTLSSLGIQLMSLRYLYSKDILIFDPDQATNLDEMQLQEILILRPFILAGTPIKELQAILNVLPPISGVASLYNFNWTNLSWEEKPSDVETDENTISAYIDDLEDTNHLIELKEAIETRLNKLLAEQ